MNLRRLALVAGFVWLTLFVSLGVAFIRSNSQTSDEAMHLGAGYSYLTTGDFRLNSEHPPLAKEWAALPLLLIQRLPFMPDARLWGNADETMIGERFLYETYSVDAKTILTYARLPILVLGAALLSLIGLWAYRLWGPWGSALSMGLAALDPTLLAHSCLVHTDVASALFTLLPFYCAWEYLRRPRLVWIAAAAAALFLGMASKHSNVFVPVMLAAVLAAIAGFERRFPLPRSAGDTIVFTAVSLCLASLIIPAAYGFQGFGQWSQGMDIILSHQSGGHPSFLLGKYSTEGWWYYFPVAFLLKTPVGTLLIIAASLATFRRGLPRREALLLYGPPAILLAVMTQGQINIGLRHILGVYPFLFVAAGRLATLDFSRRWLRPALCVVPLILTGFSSLRVAPHQLAYFNELVGGPGEGYRYLSDSNVDWGQDLGNLKRWLDEHHAPPIYLSYFGNAPPSYWGIQYQMVPPGPEQTSTVVAPGTRPELFAISVFNLQGVWADDHDLYRWLWSRTPIAKIGASIFVYDLTGDGDAHKHLAEVIAKCTHLAEGQKCGIWTLLNGTR